jgi:ribose transport system permease protein
MANRPLSGVRGRLPPWLLPEAEEGDQESGGRGGPRTRVLRLIVDVPEASILVAVLVLFVVLAVFATHFFTFSNLLSVAQQIAFLGIVATGETFLLVAGELDLSVGSAYGFLGIVLAWLLARHGIALIPAILLTLAAGIAIGVVNGLFTTRFRIPSFIVTLGMLGVLRGLALALAAGLPITLPSLNPAWNAVSTGTLFGVIPAQVIWLVAVLILGSVVLARTKFGYAVYATGGNRRSAAQVGIKTGRVKFYCFVVTGALVALISILSVGWLGSADPTNGNGFELQVIAAVVIGGTSLFGGAGSVFGTFLGAAVIGMLSNGLILLGLDQYWQQFATGTIIVAAALLNVTIRRRALPDL